MRCCPRELLPGPTCGAAQERAGPAPPGMPAPAVRPGRTLRDLRYHGDAGMRGDAIHGQGAAGSGDGLDRALRNLPGPSAGPRDRRFRQASARTAGVAGRTAAGRHGGSACGTDRPALPVYGRLPAPGHGNRRGAGDGRAAQGIGNPRHPCRNVGETGAVRIRGAPGKRPEHGAAAHGQGENRSFPCCRKRSAPRR